MEIRDRIKVKAEELFRIYGIRSVTMDEIAGQLGVSKKTIYQSYSDKSELVDEVVVDTLERNKTNCICCRTDASNAVHEIFLGMKTIKNLMAEMNPSILFDLERGYPKSFRRFVGFKNDYLSEFMMDNLKWGKEEGLYRKEINDEIYIKTRLEMVSLAFNEQVFPKSKFTLSEIQRELLELFLYAIISPKGLKLIEKYKREQQ